MKLSLLKYLGTLIPHIEKNDILEDLDATSQEIQTTVLPAYNAAAAFFGSDKFKSKDNKDIDGEIRHEMKFSIGRATSFIPEFAARLNKIDHNLTLLTKAINSEIGRDVVTDGVSSKRVVLIRVAEKISFVSRACMDLLNLVYLNEASETDADTREIGLAPIEITNIRKSVGNLARLLESYGIDSKDFQHAIDKTPDLILTRADTSGIEGVYTDRQLDPLTTPVLVGFTGNPIYHIRLVFAEWQAKRYKANEEKKKILELRLLHLQMVRDKSGSSPALEKEIAHYQSRVSRLDRELLEVQEDLELVG